MKKKKKYYFFLYLIFIGYCIRNQSKTATSASINILNMNFSGESDFK